MHQNLNKLSAGSWTLFGTPSQITQATDKSSSEDFSLSGLNK